MNVFFSEGFIRERRALALLSLGAMVTLFILLALAQGGAWVACFSALAFVYGLGFFAVASEWFWARWFATGIGMSGLTTAALGLVTGGINGGIIFWGLVHASIYLPLLGSQMARTYEEQKQWREYWNLDDAAVLRIKRAVYSTATALPTLILYTLAPRRESLAILSIAALFFTIVGLWSILKMRTWGIFSILSAFICLIVDGVSGIAPQTSFFYQSMSVESLNWVSLCFLGIAISIFTRPILSYLKN